MSTTSAATITTAPYKFTGKERDSESNLDNFGARYYSSAQGRFMSPDPMGGHLLNPQSLNHYAYVLNNPLSFIDPLGLDCVYLNDAGTGVDSVDPDSNTNISECQSNGGFYADGTYQQGWFDPNSNDVWLQTTDNGNTGLTEAGLTDAGTSYSTETDWFPGTAQLSAPGLALQSPTTSSSSPFQGLDFLNCSGCANIWSSTYGGMNTITKAYAYAYGAAYAPEAYEGLQVAQQLGRSLAQNPAVLNFVTDAVEANLPGGIPASWGGLLGGVASNWSQISGFLQNTYQSAKVSVPH